MIILYVLIGIVVLYFTEVIALLWQCEYLPELDGASKYVISIPYLSFIFFFAFVKQGKFGFFRNLTLYLLLPQKNLIILTIFYTEIEKLKRSKTPIKMEYRGKEGREREAKRNTRDRYTQKMVESFA